MTTTKKISELPSAVTPLVGDEDIPIVQGGATRRATPDDIVNGKADSVTDGYTADFTQSAANIGTIHENNANHGRADIALFSGLTSGRFHIQRGTGGIILASAEL